MSQYILLLLSYASLPTSHLSVPKDTLKHKVSYFGQRLSQTLNLRFWTQYWTKNQIGPELIKISFSTQLSMQFFLLINVKMPTIVGILTLMSRKNNILDLSEPEKC